MKIKNGYFKLHAGTVRLPGDLIYNDNNKQWKPINLMASEIKCWMTVIRPNQTKFVVSDGI